MFQVGTLPGQRALIDLGVQPFQQTEHVAILERIDQLIFEEGAGQKIKEKRNDGLKIMGFHLKLKDIL